MLFNNLSKNYIVKWDSYGEPIIYSFSISKIPGDRATFCINKSSFANNYS